MRPPWATACTRYKLTAFVIAAAYAGFAGGLLGVMQAFMPPDAFTFDTSGQLVMQTAIGGRGTLFGPLVGAAVWLFLAGLPAGHVGPGRGVEARAGAGLRLLVCFLRDGILGGPARPVSPVPPRAPRRRRPPRRTPTAA